MKLRSLLFTVLSFLMVCSCGKDDDNTGSRNQAPDLITEEVDAPEDTPDQTTFATLEASDPDGDSFIFSLDASEAMFRITATGGLQLKTGQQFNRTTATQHTVNVTVIDENGAETEGAVTINVKEAGEEANLAPTIHNEILEFEVSEDISDSETIGMVDASDPEDQNLEYSVISQIELIEISDEGELSLVAGEAFDYETATSHTVSVRVSDGENIVDTDFTIVLQNVNDTPFITTWQTIMADQTIQIGTDPEYPVNFEIDWGDGTVETVTDNLAPLEHTYAAAKTYNVSILGEFPSLYMNGNNSAPYLRTVEQWGENVWHSLSFAFSDCDQMTYNATDAPNLKNVTDLSYMFKNAALFNGDIRNWDVSQVRYMQGTFQEAALFNADIGSWVVSKVEDMSRMFYNADSFNQNIGDWIVTTVTNMNTMFSGASKFNHDIGDWEVGAVTDMGYMFSGAHKFNQDIGEWEVGAVTD
ncbi:MAG: BspA family leucine-rich repeat surface protein, partial [Bacteroidota bacterium]